jgi:hypothetical protein
MSHAHSSNCAWVALCIAGGSFSTFSISVTHVPVPLGARKSHA